jgi:hypothetical protein
MAKEIKSLKAKNRCLNRKVTKLQKFKKRVEVKSSKKNTKEIINLTPKKKERLPRATR